MSIDKITTYVENADERTLSQYDNSTRLKELIQFFAEQGQDLEDIIHSILVNHTLDNATGVILDTYGILLGWERVAEVDEDDDDYRNLLNIGIKVNISDGRAVTIIDIFSQHLKDLDPASIVQYIVNSPASYEIMWITDETRIGDLNIDRINQINERILPLGVGSAVVQGTSDAFRLDDSTYGLDNGKMGRRIDNL